MLAATIGAGTEAAAEAKRETAAVATAVRAPGTTTVVAAGVPGLAAAPEIEAAVRDLEIGTVLNATSCSGRGIPSVAGAKHPDPMELVVRTAIKVGETAATVLGTTGVAATVAAIVAVAIVADRIVVVARVRAKAAAKTLAAVVVEDNGAETVLEEETVAEIDGVTTIVVAAGGLAAVRDEMTTGMAPEADDAVSAACVPLPTAAARLLRGTTAGVAADLRGVALLTEIGQRGGSRGGQIVAQAVVGVAEGREQRRRPTRVLEGTTSL